MGRWCGLVASILCFAGAVGASHLHGYERALGSEDWQYRAALIEAYSGEVAFRAGPCVLAGIAALFAARHRTTISIASVSVSAMSVVATYLTIRQYIVTSPGQLMSSEWDVAFLPLWIAGVGLMVFAIRVRE
jgi:hypothetical protein